MRRLIEVNNICYYVFMFCAYKFYMGSFFERKKYKNQRINKCIFIFLYILLSFLPNLGLIRNIIIMSLLAGICGSWMYQGKIGKIFFHGMLWEVMGCLCEYVILFIMTISYTEETIFKPGYYSMAQIVSECLFVFLTLFINKIIFDKKYQNIKLLSNIVLLHLACATVMVDWGVYRIYIHQENATDDYYAVLIATIMMGISIIIIKIYEGLGEKAELETRNMVYQTQVEAYRVQISEREEAVKEFRLLKHDMKNHLIYMEELIRQKKDEEVCKYIDELLNSRGLSHQGIVNSGNILVDGLINYKIPYMKSLNIDFQAEIAIPFDLKWPEDNLCIIIGNLLDNAIEGTQKLKEEERQIYLEMMLKVDNLFILIKNPCMEQSLMKKGDHFLTTKNEEGHGMGLLSVKRAVEECQGSIYTNVENGIFQASVMLPRVENKTDQEEN